jgi:hypothetical protein
MTDFMERLTEMMNHEEGQKKYYERLARPASVQCAYGVPHDCCSEAVSKKYQRTYIVVCFLCETVLVPADPV